MPKKLMWVEWDDDAELSRSQKRPGAYSPLTRDADRNLGQVTLDDADEYEYGLGDDWTQDFDASGNDNERLTAEEIARLVLTINSVVVAAKPHVTRWWKSHARPTIKSANESLRNRFAGTRKTEWPTEATEEATSLDVSPEEHLPMTADEAQQRLLAALVARAFSDEQVRLLMRARIEDADSHPQFKGLVGQLTPEEFEIQVGLLLESNPTLVDDFFSFFRGSRAGNRIEDIAKLPPGSERSEVAKEVTGGKE